jgi:hypothetical protein
MYIICPSCSNIPLDHSFTTLKNNKYNCSRCFGHVISHRLNKSITSYKFEPVIKNNIYLLEFNTYYSGWLTLLDKNRNAIISSNITDKETYDEIISLTKTIDVDNLKSSSVEFINKILVLKEFL